MNFFVIKRNIRYFETVKYIDIQCSENIHSIFPLLTFWFFHLSLEHWGWFWGFQQCTMYVCYDRVSYKKKHNVFLAYFTYSSYYTYCFENFPYFSIIRTVDHKIIFLLHEKFNSLETNMITLLIYLKVGNYMDVWCLWRRPFSTHQPSIVKSLKSLLKSLTSLRSIVSFRSSWL